MNTFNNITKTVKKRNQEYIAKERELYIFKIINFSEGILGYF